MIIESASGRAIRPRAVLGGALDGHDHGEIAAIYTPGNLAVMKSAGLGPVAYRLRTELAIEAWHWNPRGAWSDPLRHQGYWTSSDRSAAPIEVSYGYRLPRRGRTLDDGNNDGYSRIDDGDSTSFWKTNPYLDPRFTGEAESLHPQWMVIDLDSAVEVRAARIQWGEPYAVHYQVAFWEGDQTTPIDRNPAGAWHRFPRGDVGDGHGGSITLVLGDSLVRTRFVRVTLLQSSHTAPPGAGDPRDSAGFALREIALGSVDGEGHLQDRVRHGTAASWQSQVLVSSTDPWHRESDRDDGVEQPGFDRVFRSGLSAGLPVLVPVGILFDTPDNAASELRFLRRRGYRVQRVELGEEPDGQRVTPEDYAALYLQTVRQLRGVDPDIVPGGPAWQTTLDATLALWPDRTVRGTRSTWLGRFLDYIEPRSRGRAWGFFSFEWYPFDDSCGDTESQLAEAPGLLSGAIGRLRAAGLADSIPWIMTEYGYSAYAGPPEVQLPGALFNADVVGNFLSLGGSEAYLYGYEPGSLLREPRCSDWGNNMLFLGDDRLQARYRLPTYYAARLLTRIWADSGGGTHRLTPTRILSSDSLATRVSAFALRRPDGRWGLLLINRDPKREWLMTIAIAGAAGDATRAPSGALDIWRYGPTQFHWRPGGRDGRPARDLPPARETATGSGGSLRLPPSSLAVVIWQ